MPYIVNKIIVCDCVLTVLFDERTWSDEKMVGCLNVGWFAAGHYLNAHAIAYWDELSSKVVPCNVTYSKSIADTIFHEISIRADSDEEAIEKFKKICMSPKKPARMPLPMRVSMVLYALKEPIDTDYIIPLLPRNAADMVYEELEEVVVNAVNQYKSDQRE